MGETDDANEYDSGLVFKHLVFYLDTHTNARENGMVVPQGRLKHGQAMEDKFKSLKGGIEQNGGKITEHLSEPRLTHVLVDSRDETRKRELMKRTSQPKRRHVVISEYVEACIAEETLLDEDEFAV